MSLEGWLDGRCGSGVYRDTMLGATPDVQSIEIVVVMITAAVKAVLYRQIYF